MKLWGKRVHLPPDGDVPSEPPGPPPLPLNDQHRYRLMVRYGLSPEQVHRLPLDIAWTLMRLP